MNRRSVLALPVFLASVASASAQPVPAYTPTPQDRADLNRIETYLDGLRSLKARFLQVSPTGETVGGTAWLVRPGRMRFEYDPPSPLLLVAGDGLVVFHDSQLDQTSNVPTSSTPLGILLADHVKLSGAVTVSDFKRLPGQLQVTMYRTASPQDGTLTLVFADNPMSLRQWIVVDAQRQATKVSLFSVQLGGTFDDKLFHFFDPRLIGPQYFTPNGG